MSQKKIKNSL